MRRRTFAFHLTSRFMKYARIPFNVIAKCRHLYSIEMAIAKKKERKKCIAIERSKWASRLSRAYYQFTARFVFVQYINKERIKLIFKTTPEKTKCGSTQKKKKNSNPICIAYGMFTLRASSKLHWATAKALRLDFLCSVFQLIIDCIGTLIV